MSLPDPFRKCGASALRGALEADPTVQREQPSEAQRRILGILLDQRDQKTW